MTVAVAKRGNTKKRAGSPARSVRKPQPFSRRHFQEWGRGFTLDNGEAWEVERYFLDFVEDVFAGFTVCWLIVPEENAKTTNSAGLALYFTEHLTGAYVPVAASTRDQAEWLYRQAEGLVVNSDLEDETRSTAQRSETPHRWRCLEGYRRIRHDATNSRIQIFAADDRGGDGAIPGGISILDELHRHRDLALYRTWLGKLRKRNAQQLVLSTGGESGSEFEKVRQELKVAGTTVSRRGRCFIRSERCLDEKKLAVIHDYAVPEDGNVADMKLVKEANPFSGITVQTLEEKFSLADDIRHWRRFTCNQASLSGSVETFIEVREWQALGTGELIPPGVSVCVGADGSRTWDTTVVAWACPMEDGFVDVDARVFSVRADVAHHILHRGGKIDFDDVESFILDTFDSFDVIEAAYDPRYLERSMEIVDSRLPEACIFAVEPHSVHMRHALQTMYTLAAEGKLRHRPDPVIDAHVANAKVERGHQSEIRRLGKINAKMPIDAVPAMALAVWRAASGLGSVYDEREIIEI